MQKILVLDNNDSFTFNIVDLLRRLPEISFSVIKSFDLSVSIVEKFDKVIISPGPGLPKDFPILTDLFLRFLKQKPILGICLGHQALAEFLGASLIRLQPVIHGQSHKINILKEDKLFSHIPKTFSVGLYHSWAVAIHELPSSLDILAISEHDVIMAIKYQDFPVYGLQFHPESYISEYGLNILKNFMDI
jgi:anthranilate synthase/aminodeoxychorismate synthase-like glutamine amidotransferase